MDLTLTMQPFSLELDATTRSPALELTDDVALASQGDARAFRRLYESHKDRVYALARRMAGADRAAEFTQDVFVRAWQKLGTFRGEAKFSTWLHRLAVNLILSQRASDATRRWRFLEDEVAIDTAPARPSGRELSLDFEKAIEHLPDGARTVFVLHDVEGYKHEEIGRLLGISTGTTKAQLHRARMLLRRHLTP
jgi:RNA polymerase sigma-70 factor (ECF subfamily)